MWSLTPPGLYFWTSPKVAIGVLGQAKRQPKGVPSDGSPHRAGCCAGASLRGSLSVTIAKVNFLLIAYFQRCSGEQARSPIATTASGKTSR